MDREKLINREKWDAGEVCVVCGSPYVQIHHIFPGTANRKQSDKYGYIIPLCAKHHTGDAGIHSNAKLMREWKETAQRHFERHKGNRREFIEKFGKSYL